MSSDKGFFERWKEGNQQYASSLEGQLTMKKWFMRIVVFGLFGGSIERAVSGDYFMALVLFGFGGIMVIDYRNIMRQLGNIENVRRME